MVTRTCQKCGVTFPTYPSITRKYCSTACFRDSQKRPPKNNGDGTASVPLSCGEHAIIDIEDVATVSQYTWSFMKGGYAYNETAGYMHRFIMSPSPSLDVDHIDGDGLNNTRRNLRLATRSQNLMNSGKRVANKTGLKGVSIDKKRRGKPFVAQIKAGEKRLRLGNFSTAIEAACAYDAAARELHGTYARTNFPEKVDFGAVPQ